VIEWIGTGWNPSMTPRAMVIEDDMTQRLFTAFVVKQLGLETTCVSSASEALQFLRDGDMSTLPHIIICDVRLPDIQCPELVPLIHQLHEIPVIANSASDDETIMEKCICAGCADYVVKPIRMHELKMKVKLALMKQSNQHRTDNKLRQEVLSQHINSIAHDIGTPLTTMNLATDVLIGELKLGCMVQVTQQHHDLLSQVVKSARLIEIVSQKAFDLQNIMSNRLQMVASTCDLRNIIDDQLITSRYLSHGCASVEMVTDVSPEISTWIVSDPGWLACIILELISNARKFTEKGTIKLTAAVALHGGRRQLEIVCEDTGVGIAPDLLPQVWMPFTQIRKDAGGSGLGLFVVASKVRALGGEYHATANNPQGSIFTLRLPYEEGPGLEGVASPEPAVSGDVMHTVLPDGCRVPVMMKAGVNAGNSTDSGGQTDPAAETECSKVSILIIDDTPSIRKLLSLMLDKLGIHADTAENGEEGLHMLCAGQYAVVFCDVMMPVMDGLECICRFRKWEQQHRPDNRQLVYGLTAQATDQTIEACRNVGMDRVVAKPVTKASLRTHLSDIPLCKHALRSA